MEGYRSVLTEAAPEGASPAYLSGGRDSLVSVLRHRAESQPDGIAFTYLTDGEHVTERLTYSELDRRARALAAVLRSRYLEGQRALLMFDTGMRFVDAFFGCLYAGVIAVPVSPPMHRRLLPRLRAIASVAEAEVVLTDREGHSRMVPFLPAAPEVASLLWILADDIRVGSERAWRAPEISSTDLAFLQFTSGSTSTPKGVMVTHGNLYRAIGVQKSTMFILLSFLVAVAAFNLVSTLVMVVNQRSGDIAILRTLGSDTSTIIAAFVLLGILLGGVGIVVGALSGAGIASVLPEIYRWVTDLLGLDLMNQYFVSYLPVEVRLEDLQGIVLTALALCVISTLYPAWRAATLRPSVVLAHE